MTDTSMATILEFKRCCICGRGLRRHEGNNPAPVQESGDCCNNSCNDEVVLPARMSQFRAEAR